MNASRVASLQVNALSFAVQRPLTCTQCVTHQCVKSQVLLLRIVTRSRARTHKVPLRQRAMPLVDPGGREQNVEVETARL